MTLLHGVRFLIGVLLGAIAGGLMGICSGCLLALVIDVNFHPQPQGEFIDFMGFITFLLAIEGVLCGAGGGTTGRGLWGAVVGGVLGFLIGLVVAQAQRQQPGLAEAFGATAVATLVGALAGLVGGLVSRVVQSR